MKHLKLTTAAALCALSLTACANNDALNEPDLAETQTQTQEQTEEQTPETVTEETTVSKETTSEEAAPEYTEVDPERFKEGTGYVIGGASGVLGCMTFRDSPQIDLSCQINFTEPLPPVVDDGGVPGFPANVATWVVGEGFTTNHSPGSQGYMTPPTPLNKGETTTIDGFRFTHLHDGGFRVERDGQAFEVHDGVYTAN